MKKDIYQHDKYTKALHSILAVLRADLNQFLIFVIGVSRVGKSTLLQELIERLPESYNGKVIYFETPPKMTAQFSLKPFLLRYLEFLGDPFSTLNYRSYNRMTTHELISLIVKRIKQQGIKLVMIDEADLFVTVRRNMQAFENLQFLKSLTNITGIPHVLAGTPSLGQFLGMEGQVINRSHVVRLAPYSAYNKDHVKIYLQVLREFEQQLKTPIDPELKTNPMPLFVATNGCVGALKELLARMDVLAEEFEQEVITAQLIETCGYYDPDSIREEEIDLFYKQSKHRLVSDHSSAAKKKAKKKTAKKRPKPGRRINPIDDVGDPL